MKLVTFKIKSKQDREWLWIVLKNNYYDVRRDEKKKEVIVELQDHEAVYV